MEKTYSTCSTANSFLIYTSNWRKNFAVEKTKL